MSRHRDTTAEVHPDEVEVFVFLVDSFSMLTSDHLLVKGVEDRDTWEQRVTRETCQFLHLVYDDRVSDVSLHAVFLGNIVSDETTEVAGVLTVCCSLEVTKHHFVHLVNT